MVMLALQDYQTKVILNQRNSWNALNVLNQTAKMAEESQALKSS